MTDLQDLDAAERYVAGAASALERYRAGLEEPPKPPDPPVPPPPPRPPAPPLEGELRIDSPVVSPPETLDYIVRGNELEFLGASLGMFPNPIAEACRRHTIPVVRIGVKGPTGALGYAYGSIHGPDNAHMKNAEGEFINGSVSLVGLTDDARVEGVLLGNQAGHLDNLELYDLIIGQGGPGWKACMMQYAPVNDLIVVGCSFAGVGSWGSDGSCDAKWGMHLDRGVDRFIWRNCTRATRNGRPVRFQEHVGYIKGMGYVYIEGNDLSGGNRTGFQYRSNTDEDHVRRPYGSVLVRGNYAHAYGMEHTIPKDGGSCITLWSNPDHPTLIEGNQITDARYGCLTVADVETSYKADGWAHAHVEVRSNEFTQDPGRDDGRPAASVSGARSLYLRDNAIVASGAYDLEIDSEWPHNHGAKPVGETVFAGRPSYTVASYDPDTGTTKPWSDARLDAAVEG